MKGNSMHETYSDRIYLNYKARAAAPLIESGMIVIALIFFSPSAVISL